MQEEHDNYSLLEQVLTNEEIISFLMSDCLKVHQNDKLQSVFVSTCMLSHENLLDSFHNLWP
jgi:hypothetical protein